MAWGQSGDGASSGSTTASLSFSSDAAETAPSAGFSSLALDAAVLLSNGVPLQSNRGQRSGNQRQSNLFDDPIAEGFGRNDGGFRFSPSISASASDFTALVRANGRALGLFSSSNVPSSPANDSFTQATGLGRALGLNANASNFFPARDSFAQSDNRNGNSNRGNQALAVANAGDFAADASANGRALGRNANANGHGNGNGHDLSDVVTLANLDGDAVGNILRAAERRRSDGPSIVQVDTSNPIISDAVTGRGRPASSTTAVVGTVLPTPTKSVPNISGAPADDFDLSSPTLNAPPSPVPEPASWLMLALGLAVLAWRALTRRGPLLRS